ncbi:MAG: hypothetical protein OHK0015_02620 [Chloroflexi bacterium OHK40]
MNPAAIATGWWATTADPQPVAVLERTLCPGEGAQAGIWLLTQPHQLQVDELVLANSRSPWQQVRQGKGGWDACAGCEWRSAHACRAT